MSGPVFFQAQPSQAGGAAFVLQQPNQGLQQPPTLSSQNVVYNPSTGNQVMVPINPTTGQLVAPIGVQQPALPPPASVSVAPAALPQPGTVALQQPGTLTIQQPAFQQPQVLQTGTLQPGTTILTAGQTPMVKPLDADRFSITSFEDLYTKKASAGVLKGTALSWLSMALLLLAMVLHIVALAIPYWTWFKQTSEVDVYFGLFTICDTIVACEDPASSSNLRSYIGSGDIRTGQALVFIVLVGLIIAFVTLMVYLSPNEYKRSSLIVYIVTCIVTLGLVIGMTAFWEVQVRRRLLTVSALGGASFILEAVTCGVVAIMVIVAILELIAIMQQPSS